MYITEWEQPSLGQPGSIDEEIVEVCCDCAPAKPTIIAHRGASGTTPENTIAAFAKAIDLGAEMIELDVHLAKDEELVVIHDVTVDRTTDARGHVSSFDSYDLTKMDAGSWFDEQFIGEGIPRLRDVFDLIRGRIGVNIEVKVSGIVNRGHRCVLLAKRLVEIIDFAGKDIPIVVSSFDYDLLREVKQLNRHLPLALLFWRRPRALAHMMEETGFFALHPYRLCTTSGLITFAKAKGVQINVWTVDEAADMRKFANMGVNGIITNYPERWT